MTDLSEFQQRASTVAIIKMLGEKNFSICDLDAIAITLDRKHCLVGKDYAALRGLHCVNWVDMGPELAQLAREKCLELLGLPHQTVEMIRPVAAKESSSEPAKRLRLAFWRAETWLNGNR